MTYRAPLTVVPKTTYAAPVALSQQHGLRRDVASELPPSLVPSDPRAGGTGFGGLLRAKIETARVGEFERQAAHIASGMQHLERVQKSIIELRLIQQHGQKRFAELQRDIAEIEEQTEEIRAAGRRNRELYGEKLEVERARLRNERQKLESETQLVAMEPERAAIAMRISAAEADKAEQVNRSEGTYIAAINNKNAAAADCERLIHRARTDAELAVLHEESGGAPILPRERTAWEEKKSTKAEQRELEQRKRDAARRMHEAADVIAAQAIAGAVQLPQVSPYSAYAWLTYQQEYDRFRGDHDKALERRWAISSGGCRTGGSPSRTPRSRTRRTS